MSRSLLIATGLVIFAGGLAFGQQTTSDGCFQTYPNSKVNCLQSFITKTGVSDQQCRDTCVQNPLCKAVQYAGSSRTCQLFQSAVTRRNKRSDNKSAQTRHAGGGAGGCGKGGGGGHGGASHRGPPPQQHPPPRPGPPPPRGPPPRGRKKRGGGGHGGGCGGTCQPSLGSCSGFTYYKNTGACTGYPGTITVILSTTQGPSLPPEATCPTGQLVRYYIVDGFQLSGTPDATFSAGSEQACIDACTNNRSPDGRQVPCRSFDFDSSSSQCSLSFQPTGVQQGTPNTQIKHYEKTCVDSTFGNQCPGPYFRGPQKILIGYAQAVVSATSSAECLQLCASSQTRFGFSCQSVMFYSQETTNNCILNSETRSNHPDLYVTEPTDTVDYYEMGCTATRALIGTRQSIKRNRNVLNPKSSDYNGWTLCDKKVLDHRRYRQCPGMNPNKCQLDKAQCDPAKEDEYDLPPASTTSTEASASSASPPVGNDQCVPMIMPSGRRDCEHGTRKNSDGKIEQCKPSSC